MPVTISNNFISLHKLDRDKFERVDTKILELVTGIATKPRLSLNVTKYKNIQKWMVEFISKSEIRGDKIARVYSIRMTKQSMYFNFVRCWGPFWYRAIFRAQSISREVSGSCNSERN